MRALALLLATWFGCGRLKPAPGTWGTLGALPPGALLAWAGGWWALLAGALVLFAVGIWAAGAYARHANRADPGEAVIDEVAAMWLTLAPLAFDWRLWAIAFVLFRFFDILKPWPVSWCDAKLAGGFGIMADDVVAAIYAAAATGLLGWLLWGPACFPWT